MVLPRPEGGFFTTEAPDRTYNTERGAKQAERMFQHPQMWQGWTVGRARENQVNNLIDHAVDTYEDVVSAEMGGVDLNTNEEEFSEEAEENEEEDEEGVVFLDDILEYYSSHCFTNLSHSVQQNIRDKGSNGWVMSELINSSHGFGNGDMFHTVCYILDFSFEDAYELFTEDFYISSNFPSVDDFRAELEMLARYFTNS